MKKTLAKKTTRKVTPKPAGPKKTGAENFSKLIGFLTYLRDNHARELALDGLEAIKEYDIQWLKPFLQMPVEQLIEQSVKNQHELVKNLQEGTYFEKQRQNLKLWEEDKLPGIPRDSIAPDDLIAIYNIQRKGYYKYLPLYTKDTKEAAAIMLELDNLNTITQKDAFNMLFRLSKTAEEQTRRANTLLAESEERLRLIIESIKDYAIFMLDTEGRVKTWSKGGEKLKGYKAGEITGKHMSVFYTKEDQARNMPEHNLQKALDKGYCETEGWRVRKDNSVFWADVIITPIFGADDKLKGFAKVTRDLTEKKKAEEQLKSLNAFLDSVIENLPNMVFVKDARDLRFVKFNRAGEQILGYKREDLIGKNDYDFFPKKQADAFTKKDRDVLNGGGITDIAEEEIDTQSGKRWLHTRKIAIKDAKGKPAYLLGISEDITERRDVQEKIKRLNVNLSQNNRQLEAVNKELDAFSYSVSHDLRAPLRAIHGYGRILLEDYSSKLDDDAQNMMKAVMNNAVRMGQLIDDLLAFSRMGKKEMNIAPVDMNEIADNALKSVRAIFPVTKANITINKLLPCKADYSLMEQVLTNLISNAVKYSGKTENPVIEVDSYHREGENVYFVKDNGVGFDMKYYDKLFGVFQRLHAANEFDGTGVGLALVKRIITRHGGRVWASAEPGKGATFYIALYNSNNS